MNMRLEKNHVFMVHFAINTRNDFFPINFAISLVHVFKSKSMAVILHFKMEKKL